MNDIIKQTAIKIARQIIDTYGITEEELFGLGVKFSELDDDDFDYIEKDAMETSRLVSLFDDGEPMPLDESQVAMEASQFNEGYKINTKIR